MATEVHVTGATQCLIVSGVVDREAAREIDAIVRDGMWGGTAGVVIDVSQVAEVTGALIGALMRASRHLAWRNRRLTIVCRQPELRRRLEIAGLDEMADISPPMNQG